MTAMSPLATIPTSFFDAHTGLSALAIQHLRADGRTVIVYHDAPGPALARPFLAAVAGRVAAECRPGQSLGLIECSVPQHPAEPYIYARLSLSSAVGTGTIEAGAARVVGVDAVAAECGIALREMQCTEALVSATYRPRCCAFPGFRQLPLVRPARELAA